MDRPPLAPIRIVLEPFGRVREMSTSEGGERLLCVYVRPLTEIAASMVDGEGLSAGCDWLLGKCDFPPHLP